MRELPGFDTADYPLHQAQLVEWDGFLMLNIGQQPAPFETTFAPLSAKFAPWSLGTLQVGARNEYDVKANWKAIIQNYSECYHCPLIHPALEKLDALAERRQRPDLWHGAGRLPDAGARGRQHDHERRDRVARRSARWRARTATASTTTRSSRTCC